MREGSVPPLDKRVVEPNFSEGMEPMKVILLSAVRFFVAAIITMRCLTDAASADFVIPVTPSWNGETDTTSQVWSPMTSSATVPTSASPQSPTATSSNPNGAAGWYDSSAPADGAFVIGSPGGDVYSFSGVITPTATVPGYNISGNVLNVFAEAQSYGGMINTSDLTATYTDQTGSHSVVVSTLPSYQYTQVYNDGGNNFGGLGTAYVIDNQWTFTLPEDVSNLQLSWGWDAESSAIQDLAIYTQSTAASAPSGSSWTGQAGVTWSNSGNWTGSVPGSTSSTTDSDTAVFNQPITNQPTNIDANRNLMNITFDTASCPAIVIGTTGGNPLRLTEGGLTQITATVVKPQTINAPLVLEGTAGASANSYTLANYSANAAAALTVGGAITSAAQNSITTLNLIGTSAAANTLSGAITDGAGGAVVALAVQGGSWSLTAADSYSGGTTIASGASMHLAGSVSSLTESMNIINAGSLIVDGSGNQDTGAITGPGTTVVANSASLTADQILQDSLTIGSGATVTISPSSMDDLVLAVDTDGGESSNGALFFAADNLESTNSTLNGAGGNAPMLGSAEASGATSAVPEPPSLALAGLASFGIAVLQARRHGAARLSRGGRIFPTFVC